MNNDRGRATDSELLRELREVNEGLVASSIRQQELNEEARRTEAALRKSEAEFRSQAEELEFFNRAAVGRELRIMELKAQINELARRHGEPPPYALDLAPEEPSDQHGGTLRSQHAETRTMGGAAGAALDAILSNDELGRRVSRAADYQKESCALASLLQTLAESPDDVPRALAETILEGVKADSAGVSVLTPDEKGFSWLAIAGAWQSYVGDGTPRDLGPCGDAFDRNEPLLLRRPERRYEYFRRLRPPATEALVAPFYVKGKAAGALWAIAHRNHQFDAEDLRQLAYFARFAAVAHQATQARNVEVSRRAAAMSLMRDAVRARQSMEAANRELREARQEAEKANRAKSVFLTTASHDLRQPLQTLSLLNGALRRMVRDTGSAEVLSQQEEAIGVMSRLLNALLDISKLESGAVKPVLTNWRVMTLFDQLRSEFANVAAEKGLQLEVQDSPVWVRSDLSLVGQVLRNLVSNGIKYTHRGTVGLRARAEGEVVRIEVGDTGIGMAPEELNHIYEEFYQIGVPANATREGYGLGLSIVSRIVKLLKLKLDVSSEVGRGSTFALELPAGVATIAAHGSDRSSTERPAPSAHHVLIVEDEPAVLNATRLLLTAEGYRVATAASAAQAVERVQESPDLDLILTDYHLAGGETGTQVIAAVRAIRGPRFKAVMITGDTSTAARGVEGDENLHFLNKPVDPTELLRLLEDLLARR